MEAEEGLEDVEDLGHLGEDESAVAALDELMEELGELLQLAAVVLQQPAVGKGDGQLKGRLLERIRLGP